MRKKFNNNFVKILDELCELMKRELGMRGIAWWNKGRKNAVKETVAYCSKKGLVISRSNE